MEPRLRALFSDRLIVYAGRRPSASPAVGSLAQHRREQADVVAQALGLPHQPPTGTVSPQGAKK
jgi:2-oxoglutarate dehydrogenase complex dehydrogenase (E1) component-like enzyme